MKKNILKEFNNTQLIIVTILVFLVGAFVGCSAILISEYDKSDVSINISCETDENMGELISVYETILNNYYMDVNREELIEGAIEGLLSTLNDPYTTYMDKDETSAFNERMEGDYEGIGAYIGMNEDGRVIISQPFIDSPAEKAGLQAMDVISEIDGVDTEGMTTETAASLIKGKADTSVVLKIERSGEVLTVSIKRDTIIIHSVSSKLLEGNEKIGYISIEMFSENSYEDFETELLKAESSGVSSLIIDVRNNSGGYLNEVSEMLSLFLGKGEIIYQLSDKDETYNVKSITSDERSYDIVVLINGYSASASEILAAGLKESYGARLVGMTTYGKGLVQTPDYLDTGGMIKYSNQKWLTPNGNWVHEVGIDPDYEVTFSETYFSNPSDETDDQLQKAIDLLK